MKFFNVCGLFWLATVQQVYSKHTIEAYNCFNADKIAKYKTKSMCREDKKVPPVVKHYDIVQRSSTREVHGHKCNVFRSQFPAMCGVWGHLKLADVPEIMHQLPVPPAWCHEMANGVSLN